MWDRHLAAQGPLVGTTGANLDYAAELGIDLERERHRDRAIISAMGNSDEDVIRRGFRDIRAVHSEVAWYESYRFLTEEIFAGIWRALGADRLRLVAEALERKSFEYQRGWPDLTLARNGELLLVEVKTSDRLIGSQIRIHQELLEPLSIPFKVLRIKKIRSE